MFAKLNHLAIVSDNYALSGKFYESYFGMKPSAKANPERAVAVSDGYVGLNINPRRPGRAARLDHFGIEVEDIETVFGRLRAKYPSIEWQKRPANRPYAGISTHDLDGNIFDLSQSGMSNRRDVYVEGSGRNARHVDHFAIKTVNADRLAEFYRDVFELEPRNKAEGDRNHYLTDGKVTMVIIPWHITDFEGMGISAPAPDHIGFAVESIDAFKADIERITGNNPQLAPIEDKGPEGAKRREMVKKACPLCQHSFADVDFIPLAVLAG